MTLQNVAIQRRDSVPPRMEERCVSCDVSLDNRPGVDLNIFMPPNQYQAPNYWFCPDCWRDFAMMCARISMRLSKLEASR